jgi:hypothetical protein
MDTGKRLPQLAIRILVEQTRLTPALELLDEIESLRKRLLAMGGA